jgi:hypothetical protein
MVEFIATTELQIEQLPPGDKFKNLLREDDMFTKLTELSLEKGNKHIEDCDNHLRLQLTAGDLVEFDYEIVKISKKAVVELLDITRTLRQTIPADRYITGIQVYFGIQSDNLALLFQPLLMTWKGYDGRSNNDIYDINRSPDRYYYDVAAARFVLVNPADANNWINEYKTGIRIKHNRDINEPFTDFRNEFSQHPDVGSVILTFQSIVALLQRNRDYHVYFYNCIREMNHNKPNCIKHSVLLSTEEIRIDEDYHGHRYMNRSHLCPPCDVMTIGFDIKEL